MALATRIRPRAVVTSRVIVVRSLNSPRHRARTSPSRHETIDGLRVIADNGQARQFGAVRRARPIAEVHVLELVDQDVVVGCASSSPSVSWALRASTRAGRRIQHPSERFRATKAVKIEATSSSSRRTTAWSRADVGESHSVFTVREYSRRGSPSSESSLFAQYSHFAQPSPSGQRRRRGPAHRILQVDPRSVVATKRVVGDGVKGPTETCVLARAKGAHTAHYLAAEHG